MRDNYITLSDDKNISVKSIRNSKLEYALRSSIYLAKKIDGGVELQHDSGTYLIDKFGSVITVEGIEPDLKLLPYSLIS